LHELRICMRIIGLVAGAGSRKFAFVENTDRIGITFDPCLAAPEVTGVSR